LKQSKRQEIFEEAVKLAQSGKMKDWKGVQDRLVEKGYKRAPELLDGGKIRAVLDACCKSGRA
jgi:hypothetical protein